MENGIFVFATQHPCFVENTSVSSTYKHKHGMCFYIETNSHKILFDLGKNGLFIENAEKMGVNISDIDIVVISWAYRSWRGFKIIFRKEQFCKGLY